MSEDIRKTILITGAGSGIGRVTAQLFLKKGYCVALVGRRFSALEQTLAQAHVQDKDRALLLPLDVTDEKEVEKAFAKFYDRFGHLDVLFNNAGQSSPSQTIDAVSLEDWNEVLAVNVSGAFLCARQAFAIMRRQQPMGGRIINNGSISAYAPRLGSVIYSTTKHAITGLTRSLSLDGRPFRIACGQIDIGNAATNMTKAASTGLPQADGSTIKETRMDVCHAAEAVYHMAQLPLDTNILFMTIMANDMPFVGRG